MSVSDREYMRDDSAPQPPQPPPGSWQRRLQSVQAFKVFLVLMAGIFFMQHVLHLGGENVPGLGYVPWGAVSIQELAAGHVWTLAAHMLVHGGLLHFVLNIALYWFVGRGVQGLVGSRHFTRIFILSALVGAAAQMAVNAFIFNDKATLMMGASAAIFGLLMTYAVLVPDEPVDAIVFFIIPIPMRLWTVAKWLFIGNLALGVYEVLFHSSRSYGVGVAYFAHIGGAAAGWFYARALGYGGQPMTYASQWQPATVRKSTALTRAHARVEVDLEAAAIRKVPSSPSTTLKSKSPPAAVPPESPLAELVDAILEKISAHGMDSLTSEEKTLLSQASEKLKQGGKDHA